MNNAPTAYSPGVGQGEAELLAFPDEEAMRDLRQNAGAVAGARIGADRAAVLEIADDGERVLDDLVRLAALDVGDEADAAGVLVERGIVETLRRRQTGIGTVGEREHAARSRPAAALLAAFALPYRPHCLPRFGSLQIRCRPPSSLGP